MESVVGPVPENGTDEILVTVKHKCYEILAIVNVQICYRKYGVVACHLPSLP